MVHVGRHIIRHIKSNAEKVLPRIEMKQGLVGISSDALSEEMNRMVISDDDLFKDPPPKEDCPICFLPMPYAIGACGVQTTYQPCCGKILCSGCMDVAQEEMNKGNIKECCPFCRKPLAESDEEHFDRCHSLVIRRHLFC